ncbi:MAG TPA: hypothetical protein DET40_09635 [Lentisphaeria bacterium]|nr:MAG: hypothetical protein A2X45_08420 [Lentisphaerae bacterium GWF2_50_93]HCE43795.1 hypothetical protein [Lentisphaeria bacterium]
MFISSCGNLPSAQTARKDEVKPGKDALPPLSDAEKRVLERMGGTVLPDQDLKIGDITIHRKERELSFPGKVNLTSGDLEVLIAMPHGRVHESLLSSKIDPMKLQLALLLLGAENGARIGGGKTRQGTLLNIDVQPEGGKRVPVEEWLLNKKTEKGMERVGWVFVGSSFSANMYCMAKEEGNIVNVWSFGNTILDNPSSTGNDDDFIVVNPDAVAPYQKTVTVFFSFMNPPKQGL